MTTDTQGPAGGIEDLKAQIGALETRLGYALRDRERMRDALDHIMRTSLASRTSTRRLRWIGVRAQSAIDGDDNWRTQPIPRHDPLVETLRTLIVQAENFLGEDLEQLIDSYSTLREGSEADRIKSIVEHDVHDDCIDLQKWLEEATRNVPELFERSVREVPRG